MIFSRPPDFVAVDVETANENPGSICQVGIAEFRDGKLSGEWESLVFSEGPFMLGSFHGITAEAVADAPEFRLLYPKIKKMLEHRTVVSHSSFDRRSLRIAAASIEQEEIDCTWLDSIRVARRVWSKTELTNFKLDTVCEHIGYRFRHHDALEDAKAAGNIVLKACELKSLTPTDWVSLVDASVVESFEYLEDVGMNKKKREGDLAIWKARNAFEIGLFALPLIIKGVGKLRESNFSASIKAKGSDLRSALKRSKRCPYCDEKIKVKAIKCKFCLSMLDGHEQQ